MAGEEKGETLNPETGTERSPGQEPASPGPKSLYTHENQLEGFEQHQYTMTN